MSAADQPESGFYQRTYSEHEMSALRRVTRKVWRGANDPGTGGPGQHAAGPYWPKRLRTLARDAETDAIQFRLAADALEREIARDPRGRNGEEADHG